MVAPIIPPTPLDGSGWGFLEWFISALTAGFVAVGGYIVRTRVRVNQHELLLKTHAEEIQKLQSDTANISGIVARQPTREDLREDILRIQNMIEVRFDQFSTRFDRLDSRVDSVLNKK